MSKVAIFGGYGRVGTVVTQKCAGVPEVFDDLIVVGRNPAKGEALVERVKRHHDRDVRLARVDGDNLKDVVRFLKEEKPDMVLHVAEPFQNMTLMEAVLQTDVPKYLDTANYEARNDVKFTSIPQWALNDRFAQEGKFAVLACGFDPGATNGMVAYALKHFFDTIKRIDIIDCNDGNHGKKFATNFNTAINLREVTQPSRFFKNGKFVQGPTIMDADAPKLDIVYPAIGPRQSFVIYHEELESFQKNIPGLEQVRFWMTFGEAYRSYALLLRDIGFLDITPLPIGGGHISPIAYLRRVCPDYEQKINGREQLLADLGLTSDRPVKVNAEQLYPLEFLGLLQPGTTDLNSKYTGKTSIGVIMTGVKNGKESTIYIYNNADHEACIWETGGNGVAYTTGVPAMVGAKLALTGEWTGKGVYNVEQLNPDPLMRDMGVYGLPWIIRHNHPPLPDKL